MRPKPFFPIALQLDGRDVLVVGPAKSSEVLARAHALEECGARVRCLCAEAVTQEDLACSFLVIAAHAVDDATCERLHEWAQTTNVVLCCTDRPQHSNAAMTAVVDSGPVRIAVSTSGAAPGVAKALRKALETALDERFASFVERLRVMRAVLHQTSPGEANACERTAAMRSAIRGFRIDIAFHYPPWHDSR